MASAWSNSWGTSWGNSWDGGSVVIERSQWWRRYYQKRDALWFTNPANTWTEDVPRKIEAPVKTAAPTYAEPVHLEIPAEDRSAVDELIAELETRLAQGHAEIERLSATKAAAASLSEMAKAQAETEQDMALVRQQIAELEADEENAIMLILLAA